MDNEENLLERIPKNRSNTQRIGEFKKRNLMEAILETLLIVGIIMVIPFVFKLKIFMILIIGSGVFLVNIIGIRNKSLTETLVRWISHKLSKRCYKLKSPGEEYDKKSGSTSRTAEKTEKIAEQVKEYFSDSNLNQENRDIKRIIAKGAKTFFINLRNNLGL